MKILNLKLKNINSLAGEWMIDFTLPQFVDNGIFTITGKTGSGKSSILDAVCLALYGKTPRVNVTGTKNEVMTHGETECYSEVAFEADGKKWIAKWSQMRNRNGVLKKVNHCIFNESGESLENTAESCRDRIIQILGLDFEQFTKVIMLAQGDFTAFLQADKNDKGELLEKITGTEIYGEISKKIFERNKSENDKLKTIQIELGTINILSDDEILKLNNIIDDLRVKKDNVDEVIKSIDASKKWLNDLADLESKISIAKNKLPELQEKAEKTGSVYKESLDSLSKAKQEKENVDKILVEVRNFDTLINEKKSQLNSVSQELAELNNKNNDLSNEVENQKLKLDEFNKTLNDKELWKADNKIYENLVGQFSVIEQQNSQVKELLSALNLEKTNHENKSNDLKEKQSLLKSAKETFEKSKNDLESKEKYLADKKNELSELLDNKELSHYRQEKESITNFGILIKDLIDIVNSISNSQTEIDNHKKTISSCQNNHNELEKKVAANKIEAKDIDNQIKLLDENIRLTKLVQSLEEHRHQLIDNEPCPLCGSKSHPYALGNIPQMDDKEKELDNLKNKYQIISESLSKQEIELTKIKSDLENAQQNKEKEEKKLSENDNNYKNKLIDIKELQPDFTVNETENTIDFLNEIRLLKQNEYKQINSIIQKAEAIEKEVKDIQEKTLPDLRKSKDNADKEKNNAETAEKLTVQQLDTLSATIREKESSYKEKNDSIQNIFASYGVKNIDSLKKCLDNWNDNQNSISEISKKIVDAEKQISTKETELKNGKQLSQDKSNSQKDIQDAMQNLVNKRVELFGEKVVVDEENRLKLLLENAENLKNNSEKAKNDALSELNENQAIITEKEKELQERRSQLLTEKTLDELQKEYDEKKAQSDGFSQEIGAKTRELTENEEKRNNYSQKIEARDKQQEIYNQWNGLNELVGSSDGKKFRNFAQTLTFERLISLTNKQLQKMSERYILKRVGDAANPFDLCVIDKFQNCEERTAQNLSGGEKFIVSLSLALGLANMVSKNMRIDTMFIDEGFGTLDSDCLDTAISALSNLHNEGKLIGIISHLTELKERITTHIEIIPTGSGCSKIEINA